MLFAHCHHNQNTPVKKSTFEYFVVDCIHSFINCLSDVRIINTIVPIYVKNEDPPIQTGINMRLMSNGNNLISKSRAFHNVGAAYTKDISKNELAHVLLIGGNT